MIEKTSPFLTYGPPINKIKDSVKDNQKYKVNTYEITLYKFKLNTVVPR